MTKELGYEEGAECNREGCTGRIAMRAPENCSCHLSAPCGSCTAPRNYCPECDWEEADDPAPEPEPSAADVAAWAAQRAKWRPRTLVDLDVTKIDWIYRPHSNSSMIKEGVYPDGLQPGELRKAIDGTFGGRFEYHYPPADGKPGRFKFIAYTD